MKINQPGELIPRVGPEAENRNVGRLEKNKDFASVLKAAAQEHQTAPSPALTTGGGVHQIAPGMAINQRSEYEHTVSLLLDTLEKYQKVLGDPSANLKQVEPLVEQMRETAGRTENWVEQRQDEHTLKGVIEEALIEMNKEIVRFDRGEYIV